LVWISELFDTPEKVNTWVMLRSLLLQFDLEHWFALVYKGRNIAGVRKHLFNITFGARITHFSAGDSCGSAGDSQGGAPEGWSQRGAHVNKIRWRWRGVGWSSADL
jgi:hypothetical protein